MSAADYSVILNIEPKLYQEFVDTNRKDDLAINANESDASFFRRKLVDSLEALLN